MGKGGLTKFKLNRILPVACIHSERVEWAFERTRLNLPNNADKKPTVAER